MAWNRNFCGQNAIRLIAYFGMAAIKNGLRWSATFLVNVWGMDSSEKVDIINLKFDNGQALDFAENTPGVYPAYHMNKKHWITIALDGTLSNEMVMELVKKSYLLTDK